MLKKILIEYRNTLREKKYQRAVKVLSKIANTKEDKRHIIFVGLRPIENNERNENIELETAIIKGNENVFLSAFVSMGRNDNRFAQILIQAATNLTPPGDNKEQLHEDDLTG